MRDCGQRAGSGGKTGLNSRPPVRQCLAPPLAEVMELALLKWDLSHFVSHALYLCASGNLLW